MMDLCDEGYCKQPLYDSQSSIKGRITFQRMNYPAEGTSGTPSQLFEATKDLHQRLLPIDHTTYSMNGGYKCEQYKTAPLARVAQKRAGDLAEAGSNPPKRFCRANSLSGVDISGRHQSILDCAYSDREHPSAKTREGTDITTSSPRTPPNRISTGRNKLTHQLGSPLWKNQNSENREQSNGRDDACTAQDEYLYQPQYDKSARKAPYRVSSSENGAGRNIRETTNLILAQIQKDTVIATGSIGPWTPLNLATSARNVADPVYTSRDYSNRKHTSMQSEILPDSPKSETLAEDSDDSDDIPIEQILDRMRYSQPHPHANSTRNPYRASDTLPQRIDPIAHSDANPTGGPTSPICVDSPPQSPMMKKSLPMKERLSSSQTGLKDQIGIILLEEKQRRAAENIIRKEQEVVDKEIFGEIIQVKQERSPSYSEVKQKKDSKEKARIIKEEYKNQREREAKKIQAEAAEREQAARIKEEEIKKVRREAERKKLLSLEEKLKEERRRMAEEQIEASRLKEIADREKRKQDNKREILAITEAAKLKEMELKREIARLQAASLRAATAIPKQPKADTNISMNETKEEEQLFVSDTTTNCDQAHNLNNSLSSKRDPNGRVKPVSTSFRSRSQEYREAFEAEINADVEKKRIYTLEHRTASRRRLSHLAEPSLRNSMTESQYPAFPTNITTTISPLCRRYSSEVKLTSNAEPDVQPAQPREKQSKNDRRNEKRRKKDGKKARDKQKGRLIQDAVEGGYTVTDDEMEKRLDAYMKKREENYRKRKRMKGLSENVTLIDQISEQQPQLESNTGLPMSNSMHSHDSLDKPDLEKDNSTSEFEQKERDQNETMMREAMRALAKSSRRGFRFANTAAKRTVEASDESDESEEDPDDVPTIESNSANTYRDKDITEDSCAVKALEGQISPESQIQTPTDVAAAEPKDSKDLSAAKAEAPVHSHQNIPESTVDDRIQPRLPTKETSKVDNRLVRVYTVKIAHTIDGEEQPIENLNQFLDLSDANRFAADKIKEYQSVDEMPSTHEHTDQLFRDQIVQDDRNSTKIWVEFEIMHPSQIPNFDPAVVGARVPATSWFIRFETVKEDFNNNSEISSLLKSSEIIPGHHYSDIELANYAASEYLIKFMKPSRPVIDNLKQYENDLIPAIRRVRDERCEEKEPFQCGLEKGEGHVEWLVEKEVAIEVVQYQMQGPLN